ARWITRIECSHFAEGTAYLTISRHRNDDRQPYVFKTTDYGASWVSVVGNLPAEGPVHVIRESSRNRDLLFAGTEFGLFVSLDGGKVWHRQANDLPTVPVHDLLIHPRDRELVIGTHGRSVYVMDIAPLEELTTAVRGLDLHLFEVKPAIAFRPRKADTTQGRGYAAANPPFGMALYYYLKASTEKPFELSISDSSGKAIAALPGKKEAGLHLFTWDLRPSGTRNVVKPGEYIVTLKLGERSLKRKVRVESASSTE
ncbi:MAG TPA: hypothetical protein VKD72_21190, partial [Gemmataceae bacterium]|nr:hypothetical protein [Gemmataceae bacterium]